MKTLKRTALALTLAAVLAGGFHTFADDCFPFYTKYCAYLCCPNGDGTFSCTPVGVCL